jgi:eukaryotic-like serine/threonine-protein kinase
MSCPAIESLERLASGAGADPELAEHLAHCPNCRQVLVDIRSNLELLSDLQRLSPASAPQSAAPESVQIAGYDIIEAIARGSQGIVYRALQKATRREVAVKVLLGGKFATQRQLRRFEREVELAASLRHPNIVTFFDSGVTADSRRFCVMELVTGPRLDDYVEALRREPDPPAVADLLALFLQICSAVEYAHQRGILHRDLKPANILIDTTGDRPQPRIVDFGLARHVDPRTLIDDPTVTRPGEFAGTFAYASPEQTTANPDDLDIRTDVYSLGVILYELLTNELPYPVTGHIVSVIESIRDRPPAPPSMFRADLHTDLETILLKALSKSPDRRYQTVSAMAQDIVRHLEGKPIDARRDSTWYVVKTTVRRHRIPVALAATALLTLIVFTIAITLAWRRALTAEADALGRSQQLSAALFASNIERARTLALADNAALAEEILWPMHFAQSPAPELTSLDSPVLWALRQLYLRSPCLATAIFHDPGLSDPLGLITPDGVAIGQTIGQGELIIRHPNGTTLVPLGLSFPGIATLTSDGREAVVFSRNGPIHVVSIADATVRSRPPISDSATCVAASPDRRLLAVGDDTGSITLLDHRTLEVVDTIPSLGQTMRALTFTPDSGGLLVALSAAGVVRIDLASPRATPTEVLAGSPAPIEMNTRSLMFLPGGRLALLAAGDRAGVYEYPSLRRIHPLPPPIDTLAIAASPDSRLLATAGRSRGVRLLNLATGQVRVLTGHTGVVRGLAFSSDSTRLHSLAQDNTLRTWSVRAEPPPLLTRTFHAEVTAAKHDPLGRYTLVGFGDGGIALLGSRGQTPLASTTLPSAIVSLSIAPDGEIAVGTRNHGVFLYASPPQLPAVTAPAFLDPVRVAPDFSGVNAVAYSPDGRLLAVASQHGDLMLARRDGRRLDVIPIASPRESISSLAFNHDSTLLAAGGKQSRSILRWSLSSSGPPLPLPPLAGHADVVRAVAFVPNSSTLISASDDKALRLHDARTGQLLALLEGHAAPVFDLSISPDSRLLASVDASGELRIWHLPTRRYLASLPRYPALLGVAFSPDGDSLTAWGDGQTLSTWSIPDLSTPLLGNAPYWKPPTR